MWTRIDIFGSIRKQKQQRRRKRENCEGRRTEEAKYIKRVFAVIDTAYGTAVVVPFPTFFYYSSLLFFYTMSSQEQKYQKRLYHNDMYYKILYRASRVIFAQSHNSSGKVERMQEMTKKCCYFLPGKYHFYCRHNIIIIVHRSLCSSNY